MNNRGHGVRRGRQYRTRLQPLPAWITPAIPQPRKSKQSTITDFEAKRLLEGLLPLFSRNVAYRKLPRPSYPWGVSNLRRADYSQHLKGKTIARCNWHNEPDEDYRCLSIFFTDDTMVSFRFHTFVDEEAELADFTGGNLSNEHVITAAPITRPTKDGE